jgi:hypothetical protein
VEVSADAGPVFVNVLTHLSHRRVLKLVAEDSAIDVAIDQAQTELTAALPIGPPGDAAGIGNATALSLLAGDSIGARYLLAVSAEVAVAALLDATPGGPVDGALQQIMNQVAEDLADDGALESSWTTILTAALLAIDAGTVEQHLAARLVELGLPAQVAALDQVLDQDRDGLVNAEDLCPTDFDPEQQDSDADGLGDPCDVLPFGEPETMAEDLDIPVALVVRPDWAYLALAGVEYYGGQIARVPTDGGALEVLVDGVNFAHELVVTDTSLFWDSGQDVWRSNLDGTDAAVFDALGGALPIGADETHLYRLGLELHRRPLAGGTDDIFGSSLYWPEDLSITDDLVVWSTLVTVESIGKDGTGHQVLSDGHNAPAMVVADDEAAYWLAGDACHLQRVDLADGTVSSLWMTDDPEIVCLVRSYPALGDGFVYWGEESRIMRVPRRGGDAEVIAVDSAESAVSWVRQLDVDATHVWWLNLAATGQPPESATGSLMRTPIP